MSSSTLLGHLARFGSFSSQSELLCTQALAYLLQTHEAARSALTVEVEGRTGIGIGSCLTWLAEPRQRDGGRPDLEARLASEVPVVKIEAKLGAPLLAAQLQSYLADLQRHSGKNAMLVLVPARRIDEAGRVTAEALGPFESSPWQVSDGHEGVTGIAVLSWEQLFHALRGSKTDSFGYELDQIQAMYGVLSGAFIAPFADIEVLQQWRARETDLVNVVDHVTRRLTTKHRVYPMGIESLNEGSPELEPRLYQRRFVCCSFAGGIASCFSIGVRDSFEKWLTPIWMRFHRDTGDFEAIQERIIEHSPSIRSLKSEKHLWIPLDLPPEAPVDLVIRELVEQAEKVIRVAYPGQ